MSDWKKILGTVAPTLASAYGGPLAGIITAKISKKLFDIPEAPEEQIAQAVTLGNSDVLLKLKEAEQEFLKEMEKLGIERERIAGEDRTSARNREIQVRDNAPKILATVVVVGFFGVLGWMFKYGVPKEGDEALLILLGALGAGFGMVLSYYFGSSSGSAQKNTIMEKMAK